MSNNYVPKHRLDLPTTDLPVEGTNALCFYDLNPTAARPTTCSTYRCAKHQPVAYATVTSRHNRKFSY